MSTTVEEDGLIAYTIEVSATAIVSALVRATSHLPPLALWSATVADPIADEWRRKWSDELEGHFRAMRRHARAHCPPSMLLRFEDDVTEIEATVRGAITGRIVMFWDLDYHIELISDFRRRWAPYVDPPPAPPPRVRCDPSDRSVWLDGRCLAKELKPNEFRFIQTLARAYPDPVCWRTFKNSVPACRGANQTRFRNRLPRTVLNLVESTPQGYALRLPENLSTPV